VLIALIGLVALGSGDLVVADFEGEDYGKWQVSGTALGSGPARGTLPNQMPVDGFVGKGLVNTYWGGDVSTGTLESSTFRIVRRYLKFWIGGGHDPDRLALELWIDDKKVRFATGPNRVPGGTERLEPEGWDFKEYAGKPARLRIVDHATGGWGHINVDHIVLTDRRPPIPMENPSRELVLQQKFLHFPVKNGAPKRRVIISVDGLPPVTNEIELADKAPDWHASIDVSKWKGKSVTIQVDRLPDGSKALAGIFQSDRLPGRAAPYGESGRGQFHFSPRRGWNNDPNGLVFFKGEYHMFFQHNPYGWGWGNMHWGHAVSRDLVHWEELPIALFPDAMGTMFSGSAVVDHEGRMALFYTAAGSPFVQGLAFSSDGRNFEKWSGSPIVGSLAQGDRDPKVIWHEPTRKWVMVLYLEFPNRPTIQFLTSPDMKKWTPTSRIEGFHECPDLFELPIRNRPGQSRWILTGANSDYMVGAFNGETFTPETPILKGHRGRGFYAAQTFSDTPGRRIQIGWFQTETKGMPFNQSMSIPMELGLTLDPDGLRMTWTPAPELQSLRSKSYSFGSVQLSPGAQNPLGGLNEELIEAELSFTPSPGARLRFALRGAVLEYDAGREKLIVNGQEADAPLVGGKQSLRIFVDRTGCEVFASGGRCFVPMPVNLDPRNRMLELAAVSGKIQIEKLDVHRLKSIWPK